MAAVTKPAFFSTLDCAGFALAVAVGTRTAMVLSDQVDVEIRKMSDLLKEKQQVRCRGSTIDMEFMEKLEIFSWVPRVFSGTHVGECVVHGPSVETHYDAATADTRDG